MFGKEEFKDGEMCPLIQAKCVTHKCKWYKKLLGTNPQTGAPVEEWDCAIGMLPILLIENAMVGRQTNAEVAEVRKETISHKMAFMLALRPDVQERILEAPDETPDTTH